MIASGASGSPNVACVRHVGRQEGSPHLVETVSSDLSDSIAWF